MDGFRIFRLWAACAWADGEMHPTEAAALERFLSATSDFTPSELMQARTYLSTPPDVDLSEARELPRGAREAVYRAALRIVRLDNRVTDDERGYLARLREALVLDDATIKRIDDE